MISDFKEAELMTCIRLWRGAFPSGSVRLERCLDWCMEEAAGDALSGSREKSLQMVNMESYCRADTEQLSTCLTTVFVGVHVFKSTNLLTCDL